MLELTEFYFSQRGYKATICNHLVEDVLDVVAPRVILQKRGAYDPE